MTKYSSLVSEPAEVFYVDHKEQLTCDFIYNKSDIRRLEIWNKIILKVKKDWTLEWHS